jgi:hypothetical protein
MKRRRQILFELENGMPIEGVSRQGWDLHRIARQPLRQELHQGEAAQFFLLTLARVNTATSHPIIVCMWLLHARLRSQFLTQ